MSAIDAESSNRRRKRHASPKHFDENDSHFFLLSSFQFHFSVGIVIGFVFSARTQIPRLDFCSSHCVFSSVLIGIMLLWRFHFEVWILMLLFSANMFLISVVFILIFDSVGFPHGNGRLDVYWAKCISYCGESAGGSLYRILICSIRIHPLPPSFPQSVSSLIRFLFWKVAEFDS